MNVEANPMYARYIESLLVQPTLAEIRRSVANSAFDLANLDRSMEAVREVWQRSGRVAACALLDFVKLQISDLLPKQEPPPVEIRDAASLLEALMNAPSVFRARSLLKHHRELVTVELLAMVHLKILSALGPGAMAPIGLTTIVILIATLLGDTKAGINGLVGWSQYCYQQHRFGAAERHLKRAAGAAAELRDPETRLVVAGNQARLYLGLRRNREAIEILEAGVTSFARDAGAEWWPGLHHAPSGERAPQDVWREYALLIETLHSLALCYKESGQPAKALDTLAQLISLLGDDFYFPKKKFHALHLRGLTWEDLGKFDKSAISYEAALAVARDLGDRHLQFKAMICRAALLQKRGLAKECVRAFEEVLATVAGWGHPPMIASAHNNLGNALLAMERYAEARSEFRRALGFKLEKGDLNGQFISLQGMGHAAGAMGDIEAAKLDFGMAMAVAFQSMDASLITQNIMCTSYKQFRQSSVDVTIGALQAVRQQCNQQSLTSEEVLITSRLIECYAEAGRHSEALAECRQVLNSAAFDLDVGTLPILVTCARLIASEPGGWKNAFDVLWERSKRIEVALEEVMIDARRAEIISRAFEAYAGLIDLLAVPEAHKVMTASPSPPELAFDLHESAKCRSFLATMAEAPVNAPKSIPESLHAAEAELLRTLRTLQEDDGIKSEAYRDEKLRETRNALRQCWEEMKTFAPAYVRFRTGMPYTFREMTALLPQIDGCDAAFVSFFVDARRTTYFIFRPGSSVPEMSTVGLGRNDLTQIARQLRRAFNGAPEEFPPYPPIRGDLPFRRKLDFLAPLSAALSSLFKAAENTDLIVIAPHGPLHLIPLQVLHCPDGKYLAEKAAVVYAPSLSTSMQALLRERDFTQTAAKIPVFAAGVSSADDAHPEHFESEAEIFDPIRWNVKGAFGVKQATRDGVLSSLAGQAVVHLSCHGFFDSRNPLNSGLVFSDGRAKAPRDLHDVPLLKRQAYLVTVQDLMGASLSADLVTLSACSSGLQSVRNAGDEMEGFSRALLAAAASAALVAMWNVDQASSHRLLASFYSYLADARNVSGKWRALQRAQLEYIFSDDEKLRHPYHWAPFALIGDWR